MKEFFDKVRKIAKDLDSGEYSVCSLEEAEAFANKRNSKGKIMPNNYYEISCKLDTIQYKLENAADVLEIIAESISEDPSSGAVWCVRDVIDGLAKELTHVSSLTMDYHLEQEDLQVAGPKKKKK